MPKVGRREGPNSCSSVSADFMKMWNYSTESEEENYSSETDETQECRAVGVEVKEKKQEGN